MRVVVLSWYAIALDVMTTKNAVCDGMIQYTKSLIKLKECYTTKERFIHPRFVLNRYWIGYLIKRRILPTLTYITVSSRKMCRNNRIYKFLFCNIYNCSHLMDTTFNIIIITSLQYQNSLKHYKQMCSVYNLPIYTDSS